MNPLHHEPPAGHRPGNFGHDGAGLLSAPTCRRAPSLCWGWGQARDLPRGHLQRQHQQRGGPRCRKDALTASLHTKHMHMHTLTTNDQQPHDHTISCNTQYDGTICCPHLQCTVPPTTTSRLTTHARRNRPESGEPAQLERASSGCPTTSSRNRPDLESSKPDWCEQATQNTEHANVCMEVPTTAIHQAGSTHRLTSIRRAYTLRPASQTIHACGLYIHIKQTHNPNENHSTQAYAQ
jgi:hypothetical protein